MEFKLHYRGDLRSNGGRTHKHFLRRTFHRQLADLWQQPPLVNRPYLRSAEPPSGKISLLQERGGFQFVPLVSQKLHMIAELEIILLRPGPPGMIIKHGGDIDNRMKTLLDALKMPEDGALPDAAEPNANETPFFCLLEDDHLVTRLAIETERLLEPRNDTEVLLIIAVRTKLVETVIAAIGL